MFYSIAVMNGNKSCDRKIIMDLVLGYGLNNICFGRSPQQIRDRLGMPDKEFESDFDLHYQYYSWQWDLWFRKRDLRLHWIECCHPSVKIFDRTIINSNKLDLIEAISPKIDDRLEVNDFGSFESYYFPNNCLELQIKFDVIEQVCFGHFFGEEDRPLWI